MTAGASGPAIQALQRSNRARPANERQGRVHADGTRTAGTRRRPLPNAAISTPAPITPAPITSAPITSAMFRRDSGGPSTAE
ncbi:hypothetical protein ACGFNX_10960 [Streptomyces sp. NPDC048723]|uniref:hypothetical protein n=1 Tax=Streptomyces sp. NPDC048723 TaxID=3365589 RepID=UPI00371B0772